MQNKREKRGISLIVLVITIIVMIILAAAIIISLNNTGIISNANKAVNETNEKTVQEIANLAWGEAYASGIRDEEGLKSAVEKALLDNGLKKEDYGMIVDQKGVDITKGWLQTENRKVIKGTQVLNIGDTIDYDETKGGTYKVENDVGWAILGAKDGKLLIVSTSIIGEKEFNPSATLQGGQEAYEKGIDTLNEICYAYGNGYGAASARSIDADDIDRITLIDKPNYVYTSSKGSWKYNEQITFYWDTVAANKNKPYYEKSSNNENGNLINEYTQFVYFDGKNWIKDEVPSTLPSKRQKITTITNTFYICTIGENTNLSKSDKAYELIFKENGNNAKYYVASSYVGLDKDYVRYGFWQISNNQMTGCSFVYSTGVGFTRKVGIRAVVELKDTTVLKEGVNTNWSIS